MTLQNEMNSGIDLDEHSIEKNLLSLNALYLRGLQVLRKFDRPGDHVDYELQETMSAIQQAEVRAGWASESLFGLIRNSERLSTLVKEQERLISMLLNEVDALERKLKTQREQLLPKRDHQFQVKQMKAAYQKH
ncbi:hypothetical protein [Thalassoglobus polymorphus]|uniref:Uncharacterized protein n=1 Tax=Thalassoglobus polymorphus TaxID=2527994 RepID=A0A517QNY9_9PLAN|nr:hypothetical protein [Thalassoglobus polymorphus]QDT33314.1 hypothetical protein Mal48_25670 [Thalassoglobus polymorphus]